MLQQHEARVCYVAHALSAPRSVTPRSWLTASMS
jgi:hypothetical protein